jgi:hypothetical protein
MCKSPAAWAAAYISFAWGESLFNAENIPPLPHVPELSTILHTDIGKTAMQRDHS